jgi:radical SAM protein with 4Fe4S-binding SPASM domain
MAEAEVIEPEPQAEFVLLKNVVPLATPLTLLIDPANACNFKCVFCPTGSPELLASVDRPRGIMKMPLFAKIIDDLAGFPEPVKSILLYKDGEPLLNKTLPSMVHLAKTRGVAKSVSTTTNGALLTRARAVQLIEAGLDYVRISVEHVTDEGYRKITQTYGDYAEIRANVAGLFAERERRKSPLKIHAKIVDVGLSAEQKKTFMDDFRPISDMTTIDTLMGWSNTGAADMMLGTNPDKAIDSTTPLKRDRMVCPSPFKTMAINFNGEVSVCCVDWSHETVVGDVSKENLVAVWTGEPMRQFRLTHLRGERRTLNACAKCQYVQGYNVESDLDDVAPRLIKALTRAAG